jgi:DNA-binding transcriptional regulator GbsR (MarR family)
MDSNNLIIMVVSGLLGFFVVKYFQMKKEIARNDLDREMDMIYRSIDDVRTNLEKDVERLTTKIKNTENNIYSELDNRYRVFSNAINDADRRIDEIVYNNSDKEPTLFDNVS